MKPGTLLGHEGIGVVEAPGGQVRNFDIGGRVMVCSTVSCGVCSYCRAGDTAQCDSANPNGPSAGTSFFGGPETTEPMNGPQAQRAGIPFASNTLVRLPEQSATTRRSCSATP